MEKYRYSISAEVPSDKSAFLREVIEDISYRKGIINYKDNLHLTNQSKIFSNGMCFKKDLYNYLRKIDPLTIELNTFDHFRNERSSTIFMTMNNAHDSRQLEYLHNDIKDTIGSENMLWHSGGFVPHVTLFYGVPEKDVYDIENELYWTIPPFLMDINRITVSQKVGEKSWRRVSLIDLGINEYGMVYDQNLISRDQSVWNN